MRALTIALGAALATIVLAPVAAAAAPVRPDVITVAGPGLRAPVTVRVKEQPELFASLHGQVNWLASRPSQTSAPPAKRLGPRYTVTLLVDGKAKQAYHLYPLATGGPRAHRPAKQPDRRPTTEGWFFARLTAPDVLRSAGVPLPDDPQTLGGVGGGSREVVEPTEPEPQVHQVLTDFRMLVLLNGAIVLVIAGGLAAIAWLARRRSDGPLHQ